MNTTEMIAGGVATFSEDVKQNLLGMYGIHLFVRLLLQYYDEHAVLSWLMWLIYRRNFNITSPIYLVYISY